MTSAAGNQRRVLLAIDHFHPYVGGNETLYWNVARAFVRAGVAVDVVTRRDPGMAAEETLEGVHIVRIWTPEFAQRLLFMLLALPALWKYSRTADVVHAVVYGSAFPAWLVAMLRRKPFFLTVHEVFGAEWRRLLEMNTGEGLSLRLMEFLLLRLPRTRYISGAEFTARKIRAAGGRAFVTHYPVENEFWNAELHHAGPLRETFHLPASTFVYLYFGRPGASKGVEYLVRAAALVRESRPEARLVLLLGRKPADRYAGILRLIDDLDLRKEVLVADSVPRDVLPGYLLAADCVVVPSLSEGFGYSAVEAATLGCPVIATTGHSVEELLTGEVDLVPPRDSAALAAKILEVAREPRPRRPLPPRYTLDRHVAEMLRLYDEPADAR